MADNIQSREYRKGNWTVSETMVLIEAKKMDDERRQKRSGNSGEEGMASRGKPTELRWKWVEDYCWRQGCLRSQNQCNDKWDNLMRDYKKVRDYDKPTAEDRASYWTMDKTQRKHNNLPTNMLPHIYHALLDVVDKKPLLLAPPPIPIRQFHPLLPPTPTVDSGASDHSGSPAKRRRTGTPTEPTEQATPTDQVPQPEQGTTTDQVPHPDQVPRREQGTTSASVMNDVASAISSSASVIADALVATEEREERRHRDMVSLHERRLRIEESKAEVNRQGITGLVDAITKLADSIQALASSKPS